MENMDQRLDTADVKLVDMILANRRIFYEGALSAPIGHVDFFIDDGGSNQRVPWEKAEMSSSFLA